VGQQAKGAKQDWSLERGGVSLFKLIVDGHSQQFDRFGHHIQ
jgi:hypothetical protein